MSSIDVRSTSDTARAHQTGAGAAPPCALRGTPLAAARAGIDACVHCGFCLQACPTYTALDDENDSPRGRIFLMRSLIEGRLTVDDPSVHTHIDRCLGCRACETACPSGVPYGQLLEATRATLTAAGTPNRLAGVGLGVLIRPWLMHVVFTLARLVRATGIPRLLARQRGRLGFAMGMLASTSPAVDHATYNVRGTGVRGRVATLDGCVMDGLLEEVNRATERTLVVNDYALVEARGQGCCGALHAHAGDLETARRLARRNVAAFERSGADWIAVNSAGCGAMMREYTHLLADDPEWRERAAAVADRVRDVSELLAAAGPKPGGPLPLRITYDAPCHLLHAQRVSDPPLRVLAAIPELEVVPLADADRCCGAAGIYNLIEPETSDAVLAPKLRNIVDTGATLVATGNPGCLMQIGAGLRREGVTVRTVHPVELLDAAYSKQP